MEYILDSAQMGRFDKNTIEGHGIPSLVLMERAAKAVADYVLEYFDQGQRVACICGPGNNGGDGVAVARMLHLSGYEVKVLVLGKPEKYSPQLVQEIAIARSYGLEIVEEAGESLEESLGETCQVDIIIDAIFGIGLSRQVGGIYRTAIHAINNSTAYRIAVDIPSGFSADSGKILGVGVQADTTITFAYMKKGLVLSDCALSCDDIWIEDVGIYAKPQEGEELSLLVDDSVEEYLPLRPKNANKGSQGKVLIIAGSESIYGACYLSAKAAITAGSGLVKIYTHDNNIASIQQSLPEAMYRGYSHYDEAELKALMDWADTVLIGPGLGTGDLSKKIFKTVMEYCKAPLVIDADGLNILSNQLELLDKAADRGLSLILTPHLKEMERLSGRALSDINEAMEETGEAFVKLHSCTLVLKNFVTLIAGSRGQNYYYAGGSEGLATPGSGDVLAGIIVSMLGQGVEPELAAVLGVYLHGSAGNRAADNCGIQGVLARDIIDNLWDK